MEETSKERIENVEMAESLCVSPEVIRLINPEEVSVAVLRHLHARSALGLSEGERGVTERPQQYCELGESRSVHQSSTGITFCVVSEALEPFISVVLPAKE